MVNRVVLIGRITKEVDLKMTSSQIPVTSFTLAVNRNYTSQNGEKPADFISCVAWRGTAEFMSRFVRKGNLLAVEGSIQTRNYEDQTGQMRYVTEVVCDFVQLLERNDNNNASYDNFKDDDAQDDFYETSKQLVADDDLPF